MEKIVIKVSTEIILKRLSAYRNASPVNGI
jgi:hypothetical protein